MPSALKLFFVVCNIFIFISLPLTALAGNLPNDGSRFVIPPPGQDLPLATPAPANWDAKKNTNFSLNNVVAGGLCILNPTMKDCVVTTSEGKTMVYTGENRNFASVGPIVALASLTSAMYQSPTSSVEYLASLGESFGLAKPVYAQMTQEVPGSGANIIQPILKLWQVARNIAYMFFIVIFLVAGFMIMLRRKLNPQTVISAQAALPGLVVGLIMVTFSYFIAALLIDLAFVGVQLIGYLFSNAALSAPAGSNATIFGQDAPAIANQSDLFALFGGAAGGVLPSLDDIFGGAKGLQDSLPTMAGVWIPALIGGLVGLLVGPVGFLIGLGVGGVAGITPGVVPGIITALLALILLIALFIQLFRLLFGLINTYIQILIYTVGGPFVILFAAIPGRGGAIGGWIKGIVGNALVFPAVFAAFMFAGFILNSDPDLWKVTPPLFGGLNIQLLKVLIAYGIIIGTPAIPEMIRNLFGVKGLPGGIDKAAIGGFVGAASVGRGAVTKGWTASTAGLKRQREAYQGALAKYQTGESTFNPAATWGPGGAPAGWSPRSIVKRAVGAYIGRR